MQDHIREELKTYLLRSDVNGVNKLLASGDIESPDQIIDLYNDGKEGTLLMWACYFYSEHNEISLIRDLVENHNENVNAQGTNGVTSVHTAIAGGHVPVLRFLVEEGRANLELGDRNGSTALHYACGHCNSNEEMVRCLLEYHANMEAINEEGVSPLHHACNEGNEEIVELLLSNGAHPDTAEEHEDRWTPLMYAIRGGSTSCIQALIKAKVDVNTCDSKGLTALHHAVIKGEVDVVELLLKAKADWSAKDNDGHMPVEMVKAEHKKSMETLFVETLIGMVREHIVFRDTILRGITQETCLLHALETDIEPHIAGYCDVPMGDELEKIRLEVDRLRSGRRGRKRKHSD